MDAPQPPFLNYAIDDGLVTFSGEGGFASVFLFCYAIEPGRYAFHRLIRNFIRAGPVPRSTKSTHYLEH